MHSTQCTVLSTQCSVLSARYSVQLLARAFRDRNCLNGGKKMSLRADYYPPAVLDMRHTLRSVNPCFSRVILVFCGSATISIDNYIQPLVVEKYRKTRIAISFGQVRARIPHGRHAWKVGSSGFRCKSRERRLVVPPSGGIPPKGGTTAPAAAALHLRPEEPESRWFGWMVLAVTNALTPCPSPATTTMSTCMVHDMVPGRGGAHKVLSCKNFLTPAR